MNQNPAPSLRVRLKRIFVGSIVSIVLSGALVFAGDYAIFRLRATANWNVYGSAPVRHYYAVAQKSGKTQFIFDPPANQTCIHALLPHAEYVPCWYLSRHPEQRTDI